MVTWVLLALNVAAIDSQSIDVPAPTNQFWESPELLDSAQEEPEIAPSALEYLAMQYKAAGGSRLGSTGSFSRARRPRYGSRTGYAARQVRRRDTYRVPPPLVTSKQVARGVVRRNVARTTWGGRGRRW